jgi:hypothetical protein
VLVRCGVYELHALDRLHSATRQLRHSFGILLAVVAGVSIAGAQTPLQPSGDEQHVNASPLVRQ